MPKYRVELDIKTFIGVTLEVEAEGEEQAEAKALAKYPDVLAYITPNDNDLERINRSLRGAAIEGVITISEDDDGADVNEVEELVDV